MTRYPFPLGNRICQQESATAANFHAQLTRSAGQATTRVHSSSKVPAVPKNTTCHYSHNAQLPTFALTDEAQWGSVDEKLKMIKLKYVLYLGIYFLYLFTLYRMEIIILT